MTIALRVLLALLLSVPLHALELPAIFADHMVLQRDMPVPVWGKAEPGTQVTVIFDKAQAHTQADAEGAWRVDLPAMQASATPQTLHVIEQIEDGEETQIFTDVLVGDVWHCGGQSNMSWSVKNAQNAEAEIAAADYPQIRRFRVPSTKAETPQFTSRGEWRVTSPDRVPQFSAVAYFFGRQIHASQDVPVGLVVTSWGGAAAEAYTPLELLQNNPVTASYLDEFAARPADKQKPQHMPAGLWNGMIHPVAPYAHRGVLWYQGENNAGRALAYRTLLPMMIEQWRTLWDQPGEHRDTPFLIVQLANYRQHAEQPRETDSWAELRDAQAHVAATVPNAYLATAIDIGDAGDIHPRNKQDVGLRLARLAEHHVYGDEDVVPVGPTMYAVDYDSTEPGVAIIRWNHAAGLTTTDGQPPRGFAIRTDAESPWVWAKAEIDPRKPTVRLTHPEGLNAPFDIRYAYSINPADGPQGINLVNGEGLPAMPFRTDPVPTAK